MPISSALPTPFSPAICGAQAIVVPWPPISDTVPISNPVAPGRPSQRARAMPNVFCASIRKIVSANNTSSERPPRRRSAKLALMPTVVKNTTSSTSRARIPNSISRPNSPCNTVSTAATSRPPLTGSGMVNSRSSPMRRFKTLPTNNTRIPNVAVRKECTSMGVLLGDIVMAPAGTNLSMNPA